MHIKVIRFIILGWTLTFLRKRQILPPSAFTGKECCRRLFKNCWRLKMYLQIMVLAWPISFLPKKIKLDSISISVCKTFKTIRLLYIIEWYSAQLFFNNQGYGEIFCHLCSKVTWIWFFATMHFIFLRYYFEVSNQSSPDQTPTSDMGLPHRQGT